MFVKSVFMTEVHSSKTNSEKTYGTIGNIMYSTKQYSISAILLTELKERGARSED